MLKDLTIRGHKGDHFETGGPLQVGQCVVMCIQISWVGHVTRGCPHVSDIHAWTHFQPRVVLMTGKNSLRKFSLLKPK